MSTQGYVIHAQKIAEEIEPMLAHCATTLRPDMIAALEEARFSETHEPAARILDQFLENARIAQEEDVPLCQDTGSVYVLIEPDPGVSIMGDIYGSINEAVGKVWESQGLRASMVRDGLIDRSNTDDNTPAFIDIVYRSVQESDSKPMTKGMKGGTLGTSGIAAKGAATLPIPGASVSVMLKGAGSDNASRVVMFNPADDVGAIEAALIDLVDKNAAVACPPMVIGIGIGSTFDKVAGLSKRALLRPLDQIQSNPELAVLEKRLLDAVNATGRGPAGLGGDTTALRVLIETAPCHIAALPVAINLGCSALRTRSLHIPATQVSYSE